MLKLLIEAILSDLFNQRHPDEALLLEKIADR